MTFAQLCTNGWQAPKSENPYKIRASAQRYAKTVIHCGTDRLRNIRAAHRRHLRRIGMPLAPLPVTAKYRAKKGRA